MLVMVLSVSWTIPYLGEERFGVWMTIASFVSMLIFLDLGVGNALTNHVAKMAAQEEHAPLARAISGGLGLLFIIGIASTILLSALTVCLPWINIIKVKNPLIQGEIREALLLFSILFGINLFGTGVQRVFIGLQRSFEAHVALAIGSLFSLIALWLVVRSQAGIPFLLLATLGCQSLSGFLLLAQLKKRGLFRLRGISVAVQGEKELLLRAGGLFFILQVGTMVGWGADSLIISSVLGAAQVAVYSVTQRLFQFVSSPLSILNAPLWPAYADAHVRGDNVFIRRTLRKSMLLTAGVTIVVGGLLVIMSQELISWWTRGAISVPVKIVLIFFIWTMFETVGNSFAMMMNGCGVIREQVVTVLLLTILALPAKILFVNLFGIFGMMASYSVLYFVVVVFMYGFVFRNNLLKKMDIK